MQLLHLCRMFLLGFKSNNTLHNWKSLSFNFDRYPIWYLLKKQAGIKGFAQTFNKSKSLCTWTRALGESCLL